MNIDHPAKDQIPALRALWKCAFGDDDAFLDDFFRTAFYADRCRCISAENEIAAALYWFDCSYTHGKIAYIYAVATHPNHRGQGLCRQLMADTHALLAQLGYAGAVLVPGEPGLFAMYEKMGYRHLSGMDSFPAVAGDAIPLRQVTPEEYAAARNTLLPPGGIRQEKENLAFLSTFAKLYAGDSFILAAADSGETLVGIELLGDPSAASGILAALGKTTGIFRAPGGKPYAMYYPLSDTPAPGYFGLAFD